MKSIIFLSALILGLLAQNPVPMPSFSNISVVNGDWYIVWQFVSDTPVHVHNLTGCSIWTINMTNEGGDVYLYNKVVTATNITYKVKNISDPNTEWNNFVYWLAADSDLQWALVAFNGTSKYVVPEGFILSRTNTVTADVIDQQTELLKQQGFAVSYNNSIYWMNNDCPQQESDFYDI